MLTQLTVRHLAVVDDISLTLGAGMTSLTGETGAGKSILIDALSLVLGSRADSNMVRHGKNRAEISAIFDISNNLQLADWLLDQELDDEQQCHLRRTITSDGRSRAYINGTSVPASQLRAISERAIDVHGQHAHQSLTRSETQRFLLDTAANTLPLIDKLSTEYHKWKYLQDEVNTLSQQTQDRAARIDLLRYQVAELEPLELSEQTIQKLLLEQTQLGHASELISCAQSSLNQLHDQEQGSAYSLITRVLTDLEKNSEIEPRFADLVETLNSVAIQLDECGRDIRHYLDHNDLDPTRLEAIENQLSTLHDLARKHQIEIEDLPLYYRHLCDELASLDGMDSRNEQLIIELEQQQQTCRQLCEKISQARQKSAKPLAKKITASIQQLAIAGGHIEFRITPMADQHFSASGADHVQILVSTNPGQTPGELSKVASGGELARISLAIQVVTAGNRSVPTLVFDEVDVGIGGGIAEIVGNHLRSLAENRQVLCITHLPQVAAQAHQQLQVHKIQHKESTHIEITSLNSEQRVEEIARMLGGVTLTEKTRLHAEEMLIQANS